VSKTLPQLRLASPADREFLYTLHVTTMRDLIEQTWGWDETWQREDFDQRLTRCRVSVIEAEGEPVGAIWVEIDSERIYITDLQILPRWQQRGIGTVIMKMIIREAIGSQRAVELAVLPLNERAQRLYERLGFEVAMIQEPFIYMRHQSPGSR
jgi:ribosomal protein S18 acetylase RimI-like enzyme